MTNSCLRWVYCFIVLGTAWACVAQGSILSLDALTGAWNYQLEEGDAFVAAAPPDNQTVAWGTGTSFAQSNFDFNAAYGPDFTGGDPNFSGTAQANILTTGNELTGFQMIGPWDWDVTIVFFQITYAPEFTTGFTGPADGLFNVTVGASVEPLTVNVTPVPEPEGAVMILGLVALGVAGVLRRRRAK